MQELKQFYRQLIRTEDVLNIAFWAVVATGFISTLSPEAFVITAISAFSAMVIMVIEWVLIFVRSRLKKIIGLCPSCKHSFYVHETKDGSPKPCSKRGGLMLKKCNCTHYVTNTISP